MSESDRFEKYVLIQDSWFYDSIWHIGYMYCWLRKDCDLTVLCESVKLLPLCDSSSTCFTCSPTPKSGRVESAFRPAQEWIDKAFQKPERLLFSSQWISS